jgi:hypothetical protein
MEKHFSRFTYTIDEVSQLQNDAEEFDQVGIVHQDMARSLDQIDLRCQLIYEQRAFFSLEHCLDTEPIVGHAYQMM